VDSVQQSAAEREKITNNNSTTTILIFFFLFLKGGDSMMMVFWFSVHIMYVCMKMIVGVGAVGAIDDQEKHTHTHITHTEDKGFYVREFKLLYYYSFNDNVV